MTHFVDRWRVEGTVKEVADIIEDALSLPEIPGGGCDGDEVERPADPHATLDEAALRAVGAAARQKGWSLAVVTTEV